MRKFEYRLEVICAGSGSADLGRVEHLLDLAFQDLVYDDEFIASLDEKESVTIRVSKLDDRMVDKPGS